MQVLSSIKTIEEYVGKIQYAKYKEILVPMNVAGNIRTGLALNFENGIILSSTIVYYFIFFFKNLMHFYKVIKAQVLYCFVTKK